MTTTELSAYLDAHGVPGAPTEPGWYVVTATVTSVVYVSRAPYGLVFSLGYEHCGRYLFASDITRHAPLILAAPPGRDLDAEVVAGVQAQRVAHE